MSYQELVIDQVEKAHSTGARQIPFSIKGLSTILGLRQATYTLLGGNTGSGKAQPLDAAILTPAGFIPMGMIKVGDVITAPSGEDVTVLGVFPQGDKAIFKITFEDGRTVESCGDHLWKVWHWSQKWESGKSHATRKIISGADWAVFPLSEIQSWFTEGLSKRNRAAVPVVDSFCIDFPEVELPVAPYALGALLGDGCFRSNAVKVSSPDQPVLNRLISDLPGYKLVSTGANKGLDFRVTMEIHGKYSPLIQAFTKLGLMNSLSSDKFIPSVYKHASLPQRIALLQGLFDTDGYIGAGGTSVCYCSTSKQLVQDLQEIVWSVGGICKITTRRPYYTYKGQKLAGKTAYILSVVHKSPDLFFSLPRKKLACKRKDMRHRLRIVSIESIGVKPTQCIKVEGELYVTDNYVVTHNTTIVDQEYVLHAYDWVKANPDYKLKILYFSMERRKQYKLLKWTSWKIYKDTGRIITSDQMQAYQDLGPTLTPSDILNMTRHYEPYFDEMMDSVIVMDGPASAKTIYYHAQAYAYENGSYYSTMRKTGPDEPTLLLLNGQKIGEFTDAKHFIDKVGKKRMFLEITHKGKPMTIVAHNNIYIPDNPNEFVLVILDHMGKLVSEKGTDKWTTMAEMSSMLGRLRDNFLYSPVVINQFNRGLGDTQRAKLYGDDLMPQLEDFEGQAVTQHDSDLVLALFDPVRYKRDECLDYDMAKMKSPSGHNRFRSISILKNTTGVDQVHLGMRFTGEVGLFEGLPAPMGRDIENIYRQIQAGN